MQETTEHLLTVPESKQVLRLPLIPHEAYQFALAPTLSGAVALASYRLARSIDSTECERTLRRVTAAVRDKPNSGYDGWLLGLTVREIREAQTAPFVLDVLKRLCAEVADGPQSYEEANTADGWERHFLDLAHTSKALPLLPVAVHALPDVLRDLGFKTDQRVKVNVEGDGILLTFVAEN